MNVNRAYEINNELAVLRAPGGAPDQDVPREALPVWPLFFPQPTMHTFKYIGNEATQWNETVEYILQTARTTWTLHRCWPTTVQVPPHALGARVTARHRYSSVCTFVCLLFCVYSGTCDWVCARRLTVSLLDTGSRRSPRCGCWEFLILFFPLVCQSICKSKMVPLS